MIQHNIDDMAVYARFLEHYPAEVQTLFKELLINVTCFFRDPDAFHVLKQDILPQLLAGQPDNYLFRVWVAGCASGEEAYSIAIVLRELMEEMQQQFREFRVQIYATDLDEDSIAEARSGSYLPNIALDVTPERLQRFFNKEEGEQGAYRIKKEIREMVVFAVQSVIKDPPFTKLDLLSCRNLLIYLEPEQQARLIPVFHYALKPGGVLFLSSSESIAEHADLFSVINRKCKFYRAAPAVHLSRRTTSHPATAPRPAASSWHAPKVTQRARKKRSQLAIDPAEAERAEHMARELAFAKDNLQATVEDQHANNEELQSANEEMHSSNEELLSANEELETSREELQSLNEELMTVNTELHANIELLHEAKSDLRNLFDNIYVGTLFLDDRLCIRRYTRELLKIYPLIASDIGRPLRDIKPNFVGGSLLAEMQAVLDTLTPFERQIRTVDGQWFLAHIQPYRSLDNRVKGIVLSFVNISAMKRAQNLARDLAEGIATLVDEPLIVLDGDLQIVSANASFYRYFQIDAQETVGRKIYDLGDGQWNIPALRQLIEEILPHNRALEGYVVEHDFPGLGARRLLVNARSIVTEQGNSGLILLAIEKIEIIQMIKTIPTTPAIQTLELP
jgi:chemotaxis methyl-accepting protein methylase/flagellar motility protein MotE (MotC chaperone)